MTDLAQIPAFVNDDVFHLVVESPRGTGVKLKYDARLGAMGISRPLPVGLVFPYDWGFIPSTLGSDQDPVDAFALWDVATFPGVVLECRALGVIEVEQHSRPNDPSGRIRNDRIIALPVEARRDRTMTLDDLDERLRSEIAGFLLATTALEGKGLTVLGWKGPAAALDYVRKRTSARH